MRPDRSVIGPGQFLLARATDAVAVDLADSPCHGWVLITDSTTPWRGMRTRRGQCGWVVGRVDATTTTRFTLDDGWLQLADDFDLDAAKISQSLIGSFCVIVTDPLRPGVATDACATLPVVFSPSRQRVGSTPLALGVDLVLGSDCLTDDELLKDAWYPFGLTPYEGLQRLLPNHHLSLDTFLAQRFWPENLETKSEALQPVVDALRASIAPLHDRKVPVRLPLTAGRDSRLLLGITLVEALPVTTYTLVASTPSVDSHVARSLAALCDIEHAVYRPQLRSTAERQRWFEMTGWCVGGVNARTRQPAAIVDGIALELSGTGGEIARGYYWRDGDDVGGPLSGRDLVGRFGLPPRRRFIEAADRWLVAVEEFDLATVLDLAYCEMRVGCWAAPQIYGTGKRHRQVAPFCQWPFVKAVRRLPEELRRCDQLSQTLLEGLAPELLSIPFQQAPAHVMAASRLRRLANRANWWRKGHQLVSRSRVRRARAGSR